MSNKTPSNTMRIAPSLDALPKIDYRKVQDFQGGLKTLSEENFERLRCVLLGTDTEPAQGFIVPLYVWTDSKGKHWCIDGHQRLQVLRRLGVQPYELPYVPIEANSRKQAKERLLLINSQFGQISHTGFVEFVGSDIAPEWLRTYTTLESYTMPKVEFSFGAASAGLQQGAAQDSADYEQDYDDNDDIVGSANIGFLKNTDSDLQGDSEKQNMYSAKIDAPIYEPKNTKPHISELFNDRKQKEFIDKIHSSNLSNEEKFFLTLAAHRHIVFDYEKIADYYAHSSKEMQKHMESSALVIIDFEDAILNSYVQLSESINNAYRQDYKTEAESE